MHRLWPLHYGLRTSGNSYLVERGIGIGHEKNGGIFSGGNNRQREKTLFVNFVTQVSPSCDCYGHSDAPIVPDIGILASTDPVALDQACADLVNQAHDLPGTAMKTGHDPVCDKFRGLYPQIDWEVQLEHGDKVGLGQRAYELVRLEPKDEKW